jgi:hypothetical protein
MCLDSKSAWVPGGDLIDGLFECAYGFEGADSQNGTRMCVPYTPPTSGCGMLQQPACTGTSFHEFLRTSASSLYCLSVHAMLHALLLNIRFRGYMGHSA